MVRLMACGSRGTATLSTTVDCTCTLPVVDLFFSVVMGRTQTKSVARVYADVNAKLGPSWYEYGSCNIFLSAICHTSSIAPTDNLQVQWGTQDHYEIVRKVGRGKYSEVGGE